MRIAILGATSHIAKNLIVYFGKEAELLLFARSPVQVFDFLKAECLKTVKFRVFELREFPHASMNLDAVINCVGFGTPHKLREAGAEIFFVTEFYDNIVLEYLRKNPESIYINFSSGAVFGTDLSNPISEDSEFRIRMDSVSVSDAYRISKLNSEAKHRALAQYNIIDLRVFSFFSRFIDLSSPFLLTEMVRSIRDKIAFKTTKDDIVRDFVSPEDLTNLVSLCIEKKGINGGFNIYSRAPIRKQEIISAFVERYGMEVDDSSEDILLSPTGVKSQYYSCDRRAGLAFGYFPNFISLDSIIAEADVLLSN